MGAFQCGTCGKQSAAGCEARENHREGTGHGVPFYECDFCESEFSAEEDSCDDEFE